MRKIVLYIISILMIASCGGVPENATKVEAPVPMYPDYTDVTIPQNIAPLNFLLRGEYDEVCVVANGEVVYNGKNEVVFDLDDWKTLLKENISKDIEVKVYAEDRDGWKEFPAFKWTVTTDMVDPYLTYRLIEPDYEVFNNLVLQERCVESFQTKNFSDYAILGNKCMNCHTYGGQDPQTSMFYVRGEGGGAILNMNGELQKLNLKRSDWVSGSVYFGFSPSKQFITFSTNKIIPAFHSLGSKRLEVFDTVSDVYVADLVNHKFIESPLLTDSLQMETFPTFSPDGKYVYYCTAERIDSLTQLKDQKYSLCRIGFDEKTGQFSEHVDTIFSGSREGKSVCHPRISPDGKMITFTVADYGTFPIWHRESDLHTLILPTDSLSEVKTVDMKIVNSEMSDTYHSWSSNSRWLVFASKRDDGLYGKPYYTHVDKDGRFSKPFVLPQQHPTFYDNCLKSFNAPEQGTGRLPFDVHDVKKAMEKEAVAFK